eukprot:scaffold19250_cov58-Phaeocystis_antarctica.AAC.6
MSPKGVAAAPRPDSPAARPAYYHSARPRPRRRLRLRRPPCLPPHRPLSAVAAGGGPLPPPRPLQCQTGPSSQWRKRSSPKGVVAAPQPQSPAIQPAYYYSARPRNRPRPRPLPRPPPRLPRPPPPHPPRPPPRSPPGPSLPAPAVADTIAVSSSGPVSAEVGQETASSACSAAPPPSCSLLPL